jgi:acyl dehydratase
MDSPLLDSSLLDRAPPTVLAFEDFARGDQAVFGRHRIPRDAIVAFARAYDPQPFHLDEEAAKGTFPGRLIASGWHSCAILMRLVVDGFIGRSLSMGAPGVESVRWLKPVLPGTMLEARRTVLETKVSRSRPEMGLVRLRLELLDEAGAPLLEQLNWMMIGRRDGPPVPPSMVRPSDATAGPAREPADLTAEPVPAPFFDDLRVGTRTELGGHRFERDEIVAFAAEFDPQPFHLDEGAARASHFGALCASGWHTAAVWMKLMSAERARRAAAAAARGQATPQLGPSPGFTDLVWSRPVYTGDVISFSSTLIEARPSASRPGWGLVRHRNSGVNQAGQEVFAFTGAVFLERRPAERAKGA